MPITSTPKARNFFDHNNIGNSNAFLPLTIDAALIQGNELTIRSPKFWSVGQAHLTYSNQTADGYGAINGGLTDLSPPAGFFALDHDQRNTANVGLNEPAVPVVCLRRCLRRLGVLRRQRLSAESFARPRRVELERGQSVGQSFSASLTV